MEGELTMDVEDVDWWTKEQWKVREGRGGKSGTKKSCS